MNPVVAAAVVILAGFVLLLSLLGLVVLVKVFASVMAMNARLGHVPGQLAEREAQLKAAALDIQAGHARLAAWEQGINAENVKLIAEREAFEKSKAPPLDAPEQPLEDAILKATEAELKKLDPQP